MAQPKHSSLFRALAAALVVAGCSVTVQPIRPLPGASPAPHDAAPPAPALAHFDVDAPVPACPQAAPDPVADPSVRFVVQNGHESAILQMAASSDGRVIVTSALDGTVRVWDTRTGLLLRSFSTAGFFVNKLELDRSGRWLAFYAPDGSVAVSNAIMVVDLESGSAPRVLSSFMGPFAFSPDGRKLAVGSDKLTVFDVEKGSKLLEFDFKAGAQFGQSIAFDESGRRVAVGLPGEVVLVDLDKAAEIDRVAVAGAGLNNPVWGLAFPGESLVTRLAAGQTVIHPLAKGTKPLPLSGSFRNIAVAGDRLWTLDMQTSRLAAFSIRDASPIPLGEGASAKGEFVAASADGTTVAIAHLDSDTRIAAVDVRDVGTMRTIHTLAGRAQQIESIAIHPSGDTLATGSNSGDLARWDLATGELGPSVPASERDGEQLVSIVYSPRGDMLASTTGVAMVRVRDARTGQTLRFWKTKDGYDVRFLAFAPGKDELFSVQHHRRWEMVKAPPLPGMGKAPRDVALERYDMTVERWDLGGPRPSPPAKQGGLFARPSGKTIGEAPFEVACAALSPDGHSLAFKGRDAIALMNTETGAVVWHQKVEAFDFVNAKQPLGSLDAADRWLVFSPDGKTLLLSTRRFEQSPSGAKLWFPTLFVYDAATGKERAAHKLETYGPMAWRGDTIAIGGKRPALLDASTFTVRARVAAPDNATRVIAAHPKQDVFLFGGDAGATSFVGMKGDVRATLLGTSNGEYVALSSDGAYRSSLDGARSVAWTFASPLEGFSFERFAARFDRPDVVAKRLGGETAPSPALIARPPELHLESPDPRKRHETSARVVSIAATTASRSRVDRVRVFVDGRPAKDQLVCAKEGRVSFDIPLHAGQNRVSVVAYDAAGYASNTQQIDVVSTSPLADKPDLYVLAVGVSRYPNMTDAQQLEYADDDARSITESLSAFAGSGKPFGRIIATTLLDEQASKEGIERSLARLAEMRPDDLAVVFFAGHGARLGEGKMVFMTSRAAFTRTSAEAEGIGWDAIEKSLRRARGRVLMLLDACHSGHLSTEVVAPNEQLARELAAGDRVGVLVFSAARGSQFSYEVPPEGKGSAGRGLELAWDGQNPSKATQENALPGGHGLFTSALLEALAGEAPDRDRSGAVEVGELVDYVTERVRAASNGKQTPWVARREMFGEFMVAPAAR